MNSRETKDFAERLMREVWEPFDYTKLKSFYREDMVGHHRSQTIRLPDVENRLKWDQKNNADPKYSIQNLIAGEDEFAIRFLYTAGDVKSGKEFSTEAIYFYHLREGKIDEFWLLSSHDFNYLVKP